MSFYVILVLLFIAVFIILGWRILTVKRTKDSKPSMHICPHCNERDCDCYKVDDPD